MIKKILSITCLTFSIFSSAQTTALDFTQNDCNGNSHHLFQDLDDGNVVIIEFFMNSCGSCIVAGDTLESLKSDLLAEFPGKIKSYAFGFNNTYDCALVSNWVNTNGFTSIPMINGATQVAHYGGMGMPTVVVLGGLNHAVLGSPFIGMATSDTTIMGANVRSFFSQQAVLTENSITSKVKIYPNPANQFIDVDFSELAEKINEFTITDFSGRIVFSKSNFKNSETKVNTEKFENGNYIIVVKTDSETIQRKINILK